MKPTFRPLANSHTCVLAAACATLIAQFATAADWINYNPTNPTSTQYYWGDTATWSGGVVPDGVGAVANISADLSGTLSPGIRLSNPGAPTTAVNRTLGSLTIGDTTATTATDGTPMTYNFGSFIFNNGGAGATFTTPTSTFVQTSGIPPKAAVTMGAITINDNLTVTNNMGPTAGTYSSAQPSLLLNGITETNGARKITFQSTGNVGTSYIGPSNHTGGTDILSGRVSAGDTTSFGTGTVTVSNGAQAQIITTGSTFTNNFVLNGNGWSAAEGTRGALSIGANNTTTARVQNFTGSINIASDSRIEAWSNVTANLNGALTGSSNLELVGGVIRLNGNNSGYSGTITATQGRVDVGGTLGGNLIVTSFASSLGGKGTISGNLELGAIAGPPLGTTLIVDSAAPGNLHVNGNVTVSDVTSIRLTSAPAASSTLLTYGGTLTGGANFDLEGGIANYRAGTSINTATTGVVKLNYVTGSVTWNGGAAGAWSSLGAGWVGGDTFRPFDNATFDNTVTPGTVTVTGSVGAGTVTVNNSTGTTYSINATSGNVISAGSFVKNGAGTLLMGTTTGSSDNMHTFNGGFTLNEGIVRINRNGDTIAGANSFGPLGTGTTTLAGGALTASGASGRSLYNPVAFNGTFSIGETVTNTGTITFNGGVAVIANSTINTAVNVTIGANAASAGISGSSSLTKTGAAILRVNGTSTYNGAISVDAGTFTIGSVATFTVGSGGSLKTNGGSVAAGNATSSQLVIADGATLSGVGAVNISTTISGIHGPGSSPGLQTFASGLAYTSTATFQMELTNPTGVRGTDFDAVDVTGGSFSLAPGGTMNIALGGGVDVTASYWNTDHSWLVIDLGTSTTGNGGTDNFAIGTVSGGSYSPTEGFFTTSRLADVNGKNDVYLNWTAVPEPSSAALILLGASALGFRRRRI